MKQVKNDAVVIDAAEAGHLKGLARQAMQRNPVVAHRLLDELASADLVETDAMPRDVVTIGSRVTFHDGVRRTERTVTLVYPENADLMQGRVSVITALGVSLLGLSPGARFLWDPHSPTGQSLTVLRVGSPEPGTHARCKSVV